MRDASSFWGWSLWIPAIVCFANLLQNIFYFWWARSRPEWTHMPTGQKAKRLEKKRLKEQANGQVITDTASVTSRASWTSYIPDWRVLTRVPRFFWLVVCTQILQAGVVGGFSGLNVDIIRVTQGSTEQIAGYTSAVQQVIPVDALR
ncbi:unnamed protein product, partial [Clonostachys rhizophaga]